MMPTHKTLTLTSLQYEIKTLEAERENIKQQLHLKMMPIQAFVPEKSLLRIDHSITQLKAERDKLEHEQKKIKTTTIKSSGSLTQLFYFGRSPERRAEDRQGVLSQIKPIFDEAIRLLEEKMVLDEQITTKKIQSTQETQDLKIKIKNYLRSRNTDETEDVPSLLTRFKQQFQNTTTSTPENMDVASTLFAFLNTPDESHRMALLNTIENNPDDIDNTELQALLTQTQTMYGLSESPTKAFKTMLKKTRSEENELHRPSDYSGRQ